MEEKEGVKHLYGRTRYVVLLLSLLVLTFAFSNSLVFTFTVICMDDVQDDWLHSPPHLNYLFSAVAIGCLIGTLPISYFVQRFGIGKTCSLYGILSSLATLLFPLAVQLGYPAVFLARAIQGVPTALSFPATGQIASQWATDKGLGSFVALLSIYMQLCSIITMPVSGAFCTSSVGWRGSYYFHGLVSLAIFSAFFFFYHDNPGKHRKVSTRELERISRGKTNQAKDKRVPYREILKDPCVWSIWITMLGSTAAYQLTFLYGPTYLNKVVGLDVRATGWSTAFPYLLSALLKMCLGPISDRATFVSQRTRLVFFTVFSQCANAVCLIVMSMATSPVVSQVAYTAFIVASGMVAVGSFRGASMVCRQHIHFVMSICSFLLVVITFVLPVLVAYLCPNNVIEEWARLFLGVGAFTVILTLPYAFFARDKPAKWTMEVTSSEKICPFDNVPKKGEKV